MQQEAGIQLYPRPLHTQGRNLDKVGQWALASSNCAEYEKTPIQAGILMQAEMPTGRRIPMKAKMPIVAEKRIMNTERNSCKRIAQRL